MPVVVEEVGTDLSQGPVLVTIECFVMSQRAAEFVEAMHQYGRIRRRDGAYRWGIFRDTELTNRYLEIFLVNSWAEHLRQHERQTRADRELEGRIQGYLAGEPVVRHLVYTYTKGTWLKRGRKHASLIRARHLCRSALTSSIDIDVSFIRTSTLDTNTDE